MTTQRKKVLLINGDHRSTHSITHNLSGARHVFEIECCDRLSSGLARLDRGGVDVALLDLPLKDSSGLEAIRLTRAKAPRLPIVVLSTRNDEELASAAVEEGAQDFLFKDPSVDMVLARSLEHAIERKHEEDRLRESEARYKNLLSRFTDYVYTVRVENGWPLSSTHSPGSIAVTGYAPAELERDPYLWYRMVHPDDRMMVCDHAQKLLSGESPPALEHRIIHKNGSIRWVQNISVPHCDLDGNTRSYDGLITDITLRRSAEEALNAVEQRFRLVFDQNLAGIIISTRGGRVIQCNPALARMLGYSSPAEVEQQRASDFYFDPADRDALVSQLVEQGSMTSREICMRTRDGRKIWILANISVATCAEVSDDSILFGTAIDITERRLAEQALRDSEAIYSSLVEYIPFAMFRKDLDGRFIFANKRFCDSLARSPDQIIGKTDYDLYPAELADKNRKDDLRVLSSGEVFETTEVDVTLSGERTCMSVVKTPVYSANRKIIGVQGLFWDTTERKWVEDQKVQLQIARVIQQKLLPITAPQLKGFDIGGSSRPADATGGDYFDYITMADNSLGIAIADVSGHGFGPALVAAATHACLRTLAGLRRGVGIAQMLSAANSLLFEDTAGEPYVTLIFAHLDPQTRTLTYSNAGHPPGYILDAEGSIKHLLESTSTFLGIFPEADFEMGNPIHLETGDIVILCTDGVLEAMAPDGAIFGKDRLLDAVCANRHQNAQAIVDAICQSARDFYQHEPQRDDITAVVIKVAND